jgi:hypothetical protein
MPRKRVVWLLVLATVILVVAAAVSLVRRGFMVQGRHPHQPERWVPIT